jgi:hypothetical protein
MATFLPLVHYSTAVERRSVHLGKCCRLLFLQYNNLENQKSHENYFFPFIFVVLFSISSESLTMPTVFGEKYFFVSRLFWVARLCCYGGTGLNYISVVGFICMFYMYFKDTN